MMFRTFNNAKITKIASQHSEFKFCVELINYQNEMNWK